MNDSFDKDRLRFLAEAYADSEMTADESTELNELLRDNQQAQTFFLEIVSVHAGLRRMFTHTPTELELLSRSINESRDEPARPATFLGSRLVTSIAVAASLLAFAFWVHSLRLKSEKSTDQPEQIAAFSPVDLIRSDKALFLNAEGKPDSKFRFHQQHVLLNGMIELRFPPETRVILEGPAVFSVVSDTTLSLLSGKCSVHAPEGGNGFVVDTPKARVRDLGTRFSVAVGDGQGTEVHVVEGATELISKTPASNSLTLEERESCLVNQQSFQSIRYRPTAYSGSLRDRVVSYEAKSNETGVQDLVSVTVQRAGAEQQYAATELILMEIEYLQAVSGGGSVVIPSGIPIPDDYLNSDLRLDKGVIDPGGTLSALTQDPVLIGTDNQLPTPGMVIRFERPVVNQTGPDIVLFEFQSVVNPLEGDGFRVCPLVFGDGLRSHWIKDYDISLRSPQALRIADFDRLIFHDLERSLEDLRGKPTERQDLELEYWAIATGIDLSDLGFDQGESVERLFIQDDMQDEHFVDPIVIVGLP